MAARGGGGGGTLHHETSVKSLATEAVQRLAERLAGDSTFRRELLQRLNVLPFRGIVTAVDRDNTGKNNVYIQRTGQTHADAHPYPVFAAKMVPIVGDEVLLEYVSHAPTAMVTQARNGGRPDEQDVPYSGGSLRRYDASRKPIAKEGDDHHKREYGTDGTTIVEHRDASGNHRHKGEHVHNADSIADDGTPGGIARWRTRTLLLVILREVALDLAAPYALTEAA